MITKVMTNEEAQQHNLYIFAQETVMLKSLREMPCGHFCSLIGKKKTPPKVSYTIGGIYKHLPSVTFNVMVQIDFVLTL